MELILMVLLPFPLGYLVRQRLVAFLSYTAVHAFVFTVQTLSLLLEWADGSSAAFGGRFPEYAQSEVWGYALVNLVIYAAGLGLVLLGSRVASSRRAHPVRTMAPAR